MALTAPDRIGRYRVQEIVGVGGFATVYRALDERLGVDVAVKVLAENHSLDAEVRERFVEEGRRLRRVRAPNLLAVHDIGETERAQPYLVLDLADRGDLASRVATVRERGGRVGPADILAVSRAVASALAVLHRNHLVHRDLAPKNLLLSSASSTPGSSAGDIATLATAAPASPLIASDEQLYLADLGLSKDLAVASGLTVATGTSGFAPPEQREHGRRVDHRADIWAASALVVWLAVDRTPDDAGEWQRNLRDAAWSAELIRVLAKGLTRRPEARHPTIDDWWTALEDTLRPLPAPHAARSPALGRRRTRPARALLALVVVATVAALLVGTRIGAVVVHGRDAPTVITERAGQNDERTIVADHGMTITLEGPSSVPAGQSVRLTATVNGARTWAWVGPDGALVVETPDIEMHAQDPGRATVRLIAVDHRGRIVEATRSLHVTETTGT